MEDNRPTNYDDLPLVLDMKEMQKVLGISRTTAYQLVHEEGFPAFRSGNRIKISKEALFEWMAKGRAQERENRQIISRSVEDIMMINTAIEQI